MFVQQRWLCPVRHSLITTDDSESFSRFKDGVTGLPLFPHKGAFAVPRKFHTHEGVDLYVPEGTAVYAVENGRLVDIQPFTGAVAETPWWEDTWAVLVEGDSGVVVYGEVLPNPLLVIGDRIEQGDMLGRVKRVLKVDKGRPMSMLHLELHTRGTRVIPAWNAGYPPPSSLRDPTHRLMHARTHREHFTDAEGCCMSCGNTLGWVQHAPSCENREVT